MKKIVISLSLLALVGLGITLLPIHNVIPTAQAQFVPQAVGQNTLFASATAGPAGAVTNPGGLNVSVSPGPIYCSGDVGQIHNTSLGLLANQTYTVIFGCSNNQIIARTSGPGIPPNEINLATVVCGATTCATITDLRVSTQFPNVADNFYWLPLGSSEGCTFYLTTGVFAANPANAGALVAPSPGRANASNPVFQVTTTGAASVLTYDCKLSSLMNKTTTGKGAVITAVNFYYGQQTTALTAAPNGLTLPTFSTVSYAATPGAAAAGTVAAVGGVITPNPVLASEQVAITTAGQCFQESFTPTTPIVLNTTNQQVVMEGTLAQGAASVVVYQICGVEVVYQNIPL